MTLENLTDDQIAVLTELVIHHGMYRHPKDCLKYQTYQSIAEELIDEMRKYRRAEKWIKPLMVEFTMAQLNCDPECVEGGERK